jgi:hypothetical protein
MYPPSMYPASVEPIPAATNTSATN